MGSYEAIDAKGIDHALTSSHSAYMGWHRVPLTDRRNVIRSIGKGLKMSREDLAHMITAEMGKPVAQSLAEIDKSIWLCEYYADLVFPLTGDSPEEVLNAQYRYDPIGTVLGIMPWNFPVWQTLRYVIPALYVGNAVLLKPAPNVFGSSRILERIVQGACGDLSHVFQVLVIDVEHVESVISSPVVRGVTFTGSKAAGSIVASLAGKHIKKSLLELGGSDPFIVYSDADIEAAAQAYVSSRMNNTGQTCIAAKRAIVEDTIFDTFAEAVTEVATDLTVGPPEDVGTDVSCIARNDLTNKLANQVVRSANGLRPLLAGGQVGDTNIYKPEIYEVKDRAIPAWCEELFGPIGLITRFTKRESAIDIANATEYGLGCSLWTGDKDFGLSVASRIHAGSIHINKTVSSDPRVPFGGVKSSGYGREMGRHGITEFANYKWITSIE